MSLPRLSSEGRGDSTAGYHDMPIYRKGGVYGSASFGRIRRVWRTIQQRPLLRWSLLTALLLFIIISLLEVTRQKTDWLAWAQWNSGGEFDDCPRLLAALDASVNHLDANTNANTNIDTNTNTNNNNNNHNGEQSNDESGWAKTMLPNDLFAMLERGERVPHNIIHQSWKNRDSLPEYFERWSKDWRRLHGRDWV